MTLVNSCSVSLSVGADLFMNAKAIDAKVGMTFVGEVKVFTNFSS